jgi:uncharacterized LabA/DUF88 family protein
VQNSILVDYHQLVKICGNAEIPVETAVEAILKKGLERGEVNEIRLFVPVYLNDSRPWHTINELQKKFGVEVSACPALTEETEFGVKTKDAVDAKVLLWVKTHLHKGIVPNLVIFVTGDSDFVMISNEAKKKGKKIEFWSINASNVSSLIKRQEKFELITMRQSGENLFLKTIEKATSGQTISSDDKRRIEMILKLRDISSPNRKTSKTAIEAMEKAANDAREALGISQNESIQLIESLMLMEAARLHSALDNRIEIDVSSDLFQLLPLCGQ